MTSDRRSGSRTNERRGWFAGGDRAPHGARPDRRPGPPPTRVQRSSDASPSRLDALPTDPSRLPPLPAAFHEALDAGLDAAGLRLSPPARHAIDAHVRLLLAWNAAINLTSVSDPAAVAVRHVLDSLTALSLLSGSAARGERLRLADLGSGGGFPGLPLAAALPDVEATLIESVGKKARFLEVAVRAIGFEARVAVRAQRAEATAGGRGWDVVTARAVAGLPELVELALPLLRLGGRLIAWKSDRVATPGVFDAELEAGRRAAGLLGGGLTEVRDVGLPGLEGHCLVVITKLAVTPPGYPRDRARRRGARVRPW